MQGLSPAQCGATPRPGVIRLAGHEPFDIESESNMVAGCTGHSVLAAAARRCRALASFVIGLHRFPAHRGLVLLVYPGARHLVRVFREPHLARLYQSADLASPRRSGRDSQLVTAHKVAFLAGAHGVLPLRRLASVQSARRGLSSILAHAHISFLAAVQRL